MNLRKLLGLCEHKWKTIQIVNVYDVGISMTIPNYYKYCLCCSNCGDIKVKKL